MSKVPPKKYVKNSAKKEAPKSASPRDARAMENYMRGNSDSRGEQAFDEATDSGLQSQEEAGYRGPEQGPFSCSNCVHFDGQGACDIVEGQIDPAALCGNFESAGGGEQAPPAEPATDAAAGAPQAFPSRGV